MPLPNPTSNPNPQNVTRAAKPSRIIFDPWNTTSKGHQHAENRLSGSTAWRESRTLKLHAQFGDAARRGGRRIADAVGAGSDASIKDEKHHLTMWDAQAGHAGAPPTKRRKLAEATGEPAHEGTANDSKLHRSGHCLRERTEPDPASPRAAAADEPPGSPKSQLFRGLTFYINGSTYPTISDHKLKRLLATHGGSLSLALGRRTVTHVILGTPSCHDNAGSGAGGGLAGGKIQKEITTRSSSGVRFVRVEWVLECLERGRRVPEASFAPKVALAGRGQRSVLAMLKGADKTEGETGRKRSSV